MSGKMRLYCTLHHKPVCNFLYSLQYILLYSVYIVLYHIRKYCFQFHLRHIMSDFTVQSPPHPPLRCYVPSTPVPTVLFVVLDGPGAPIHVLSLDPEDGHPRLSVGCHHRQVRDRFGDKSRGFVIPVKDVRRYLDHVQDCMEKQEKYK